MIEGFVIKEGGDSVEVRNIGGVTTIIEKSDIVERGKRTASIMPEGLFTTGKPEDLASLIAYLETTKAQ
jgi:putative heme-binding domain-containing protein